MHTSTDSGPGPSLPTNVRLALLVLTVYFLIGHQHLYTYTWSRFPYLPFWAGIDALPWLRFPLLAALVLGPAGILLNVRPRLSAILTSGGIALLILGGMPMYSTTLLLVVSLFLLIGIVPNDTFPFRLQLALVYFGAGLNKCLDLDWWNGRYMAAFAEEFSSPANFILNYLVGAPAWQVALGIVTIAVEMLALPLLLLLPRTVRYGVALGLAFHGGMLVMTFGQLSVHYLIVISVAYLIIVGREWFQGPRWPWVLCLGYFGLLLLWLVRGSVLRWFLG